MRDMETAQFNFRRLPVRGEVCRIFCQICGETRTSTNKLELTDIPMASIVPGETKGTFCTNCLKLLGETLEIPNDGE